MALGLDIDSNSEACRSLIGRIDTRKYRMARFPPAAAPLIVATLLRRRDESGLTPRTRGYREPSSFSLSVRRRHRNVFGGPVREPRPRMSSRSRPPGFRGRSRPRERTRPLPCGPPCPLLHWRSRRRIGAGTGRPRRCCDDDRNRRPELPAPGQAPRVTPPPSAPDRDRRGYRRYARFRSTAGRNFRSRRSRIVLRS